MKKAYSVQGEDEGCVIFAQHNVVARRLGANELDMHFDEVSCRRAPEFDEYAALGQVPAEVKIRHGWHYECGHCSRYVTQFNDHARYAGLDTAYCDDACYEAELALATRDAQLAQAAIDCAHDNWPGIIPVKVFGFRDEARDVIFRFPGGTSSVNWKVGDDHIDLAKSDLDAWAAFSGKPVDLISGRSDHRASAR